MLVISLVLTLEYVRASYFISYHVAISTFYCEIIRGGSMNPVRTLGPAVATRNYRQLWIYLVAPTLGAVAGAGMYTVIKLRDENGESPRPQRSFGRR